jgi:hypothetical protein
VPEFSVPIRRRGALVTVLLRPGVDESPQDAPGEVSMVQTEPLFAYLDTGASDTVLDLDLIRTLGLRPGRSAALHVLGRDGISFHDTYSVEITLVHPDVPRRWLALTVVGGAVYQTGAVVPLGRDFLRQIVFTYDGPNRRVSLRW